MGFQYNKDEIKESLSIEQVFDFLSEFGGEPQIRGNIIVSKTICHNHKGEGSHKLYYYDNTKLFKCYTNCDSTFDIFELMLKIRKNEGIEITLFEAIKFIAQFFGYAATYIKDENNDILIKDWKIFNEYSRIQNIEKKTNQITLKTYDDSILSRLNYKVKLTPWLNEGISQEVLTKAHIGYYPGGDQITIPHYDVNGNFIGLRGRTMCKSEAEVYGKYRPIKINNQLYNHPLGLNLYGLNWNKQAIKKMKKVIIFESEKSVLKYATYFGWNNNISVACCGSNISSHQIQLLLDCGVEEIIIAFDRQFQAIGDDEFKHLKINLLKTRTKYKNFVTISFIFDKNMVTQYKNSPIDEGKEKFLQLFKERILI